MDPDGRRAEFAVTVRSDAKARGLGRIALERVVDYARRRGVEEVWGEVLADNEAMLALARASAFNAPSATRTIPYA
jgi:acetyltransferase